MIVEATTYRWHGHYEGDPQRYRTEDELREWQERDPLVLHRQKLLEAGISEIEIEAFEKTVEDELDDAVALARKWPPPAPGALFDFVVRERPRIAEPPRPTGDSRPSGARWMPSARRSRPSWRRTNACSWPASTSARVATCSV